MPLTRCKLSWIEECTAGSRILETDASGTHGFTIKVALTPAGIIYKFFRVRRFFSSNLWSPYALRFARNAQRLRQAGVVAPECDGAYIVREIRRQMVRYPLIPGRNLRHVLDELEGTAEKAAHLRGLGGFMAELHQKGIWFEAGHLGNYLVRPDGGFAVIDVKDVRFFRRPLTRPIRIKNLLKLVRLNADRGRMGKEGWGPLLSGYHEKLAGLGAPGITVTLEELGRHLSL